MNVRDYIDRVIRPHTYTVDSRSQAAFRANSLQIEAFRSADFATAMRGIVSNALPSSDGIQERYVAYLQRVSADAASQYVRPPRRRFTRGDGSPLPPEQEKKLGEIYANSDLDGFFLRAQQQCIPQQAILISIDFDSAKRVIPRSWLPGEVLDVVWEDPLESRISHATKVGIEVPVGNAKGGDLIFGTREYTPSGVYRTVPGEKEGTSRRVQIQGPIGQTALVLVRLEEPRRGHPFPPLRLDLLSVQESLCLGLTDIEHTARNQCAADRVVTGPDAISAVQALSDSKSGALGPDGIIAIEGRDLRYEIHQPDPDLEGYQGALDRITELASRYVYASPEGLLGSSGITGAAKEAERLETEEARTRMERIWQKAEQDVLDLLIATMNAGPHTIELDPDTRVHVDYVYVRSRQNDLQASQSREIDAARGFSSIAEEVARHEGISLDEARSRVRERVLEYRALVGLSGGETPQGIDAIAVVAENAGEKTAR